MLFDSLTRTTTPNAPAEQDDDLAEQVEVPHVPEHLAARPPGAPAAAGDLGAAACIWQHRRRRPGPARTGRSQKRLQLLLAPASSASVVSRCVRPMVLMKIAGISPAQTDSSKTAASGASSRNMSTVSTTLVTARPITDAQQPRRHHGRQRRQHQRATRSRMSIDHDGLSQPSPAIPPEAARKTSPHSSGNSKPHADGDAGQQHRRHHQHRRAPPRTSAIAAGGLAEEHLPLHAPAGRPASPR